MKIYFEKKIIKDKVKTLLDYDRNSSETHPPDPSGKYDDA